MKLPGGHNPALPEDVIERLGLGEAWRLRTSRVKKDWPDFVAKIHNEHGLDAAKAAAAIIWQQELNDLPVGWTLTPTAIRLHHEILDELEDVIGKRLTGRVQPPETIVVPCLKCGELFQPGTSRNYRAGRPKKYARHCRRCNHSKTRERKIYLPLCREADCLEPTDGATSRCANHTRVNVRLSHQENPTPKHQRFAFHPNPGVTVTLGGFTIGSVCAINPVSLCDLAGLARSGAMTRENFGLTRITK